MQLKSMLLKGFKSFADKTEFKFDKGVTCIVGPNGCGKSNIVDAMLWILGEPSAKTLRGKQMQDVIFAGTTTRKPINLAEASLTLNNSNGVLPTEYQEVTITRRLHRDGDSEYLLNQRPVRLKDIHHLLRDSGISHQAFAIFEQGKIDEVIRFSPFERRFIFEEAAGISRFLHRKQESLKHLESVQLNLERANDILMEVEKLVQTLSSQAESAKIYQNHLNNLQELEKIDALIKWDKAEKNRFSIASKIEELQHNIEKTCQEIQSKVDQGDELSSHLNLLNDELKIHVAQLQEVKNAISLTEKELQNFHERLKESEYKQKTLSQELKTIDDFSQTYSTSIKNLHIQLEQADHHIKQQKTFPVGELEKLEKEIEKNQNDLQKNLKLHLDLSKKSASSESDSKQLQIRLENDQEQLKKTSSRRLQLQTDTEDILVRLTQITTASKEIENHIKSTKTAISQFDSQLAIINENTSKIQFEKHSLQRFELEKLARQKILIKMQENHEGFSDSCRRLLQDNQNPKSPIHQKIFPLYQLIADDQPEVKKFIAEGGVYAETLVVHSLEDLKLTLKKAQELNLKDFSLICLELISQPLTSHFSVGNTREKSIQECLSKLRHSLPELVYWSEDGFYIDSKGVIFHHLSNQNHPFFFEDELKEIKNSLNEISLQKQKIEVTEKELFHQSEKLTKEKRILEKVLSESEKEQWGYQNELKRLKNDLEKRQKSEVELKHECDQIELLMKRNLASLEKTLSVFESSKTELHTLQETISHQEKSINHLSKEYKQKQQEQKALQDAYHKAYKELEQIKYQIDVMEVKQQENQKNKLRVENDLLFCQNTITSIQSKNQSSTTSLNELKLCYEQKEKIHLELLSSIQMKKKHSESTKLELSKLQTTLKKVENELQQKSIQQAETAFIRETLERSFQEKYGDSILTYLHLLQKNLSEKEINLRLNHLRETIREFGAVNMTSIDELNHQQKRYEELQTQVHDLEHSKEEIFKIISQLDDESKKIFKHAYEEIRRNFQKNFQILFEGGEADLHLVGNGQIMDAGIEIVAKPPGKQLKSLTLLSGGEKCLTALALLFAIFEVKPSPFCILDEIDAPLDDANVDRFIKMVQAFSERCQFLVITHNKRTMSAGHSLWGISMEEKGVSKLLTLQLD